MDAGTPKSGACRRRGIFVKLIGPGEHGEREARLLRRCAQHPNVVDVLGAAKSPPGQLVMPLYPSTLAAYFAGDRSALTVPAARTIFDGLFQALGHVHDLGIMHRDIKPDNIMIDERGRSKLGDFGLAVETAAYPYRILVGDRATTLPYHDDKVGSPWYRPPECCMRGHGSFFAFEEAEDCKRCVEEGGAVVYAPKLHAGLWCVTLRDAGANAENTDTHAKEPEPDRAGHLARVADVRQRSRAGFFSTHIDLGRCMEYDQSVDLYMAGIVVMDYVLGFCPTTAVPLSEELRTMVETMYASNWAAQIAIRCTHADPQQRKMIKCTH